MVYETKKTFEIYEISSIWNVSTDDIFYTQQRNFKTLIGGGGGTTVHPSTPTPSLLPLIKKIGITSHRISQNTAEFCIDLHRKISYNFAKFGPFSNGIRNKKKHSKYTKFRVYEMSLTPYIYVKSRSDDRWRVQETRKREANGLNNG